MSVLQMIDVLQDYRDKYERDNIQVPAHEIVMHPAQWFELMSNDPEASRNLDHSVRFRNFQGIPVLLSDTAKEIEVRDRTLQQ